MEERMQQNAAAPMENTIDAEQLLRCLGATGNLKGFCATVYMMQQVEKAPDAVSLITKCLYPDTAKYFGTSTTAVERNLRTIIKVCWDRNRNFMETIAGRSLNTRPTNSVFLDMTGAYLRRQKQREKQDGEPAEREKEAAS